MEGLAIGRFRITRRLGAGGMAEVYEAKHELMDRYAAVKLLRPEMSARDVIVRRFLQEAQAAARIEHPGIVHVYDVGHLDDGRERAAQKRDPEEILEQVTNAYKAGDFGAASRSCRELRNLGHVNEQTTALCGLVACKAKDRAAAEWWYGRARPRSRGMIAQICLKEGIDVQKKPAP